MPGIWDILDAYAKTPKGNGLMSMGNLTEDQQKAALLQQSIQGLTDFGTGLSQAGAGNAQGRKVSFGEALGGASQYQDRTNRQRQNEQLSQLLMLSQAQKASQDQWGETKDAMGNPILYNKNDPNQIKQLGTPMGGTTPASNGATGPEFLSTLQPQVADQVKAIAEGRLAPPSGYALKSPYWQQMMQAVSQYDPNFDAVNYGARAKTRNDFTSGKSRQNIVAIETALNHLADLQGANETLGGAQFGNSTRNFFLNQASDPNLTSYNVNAKTAADEVAKATAGPGGSTVSDREERMKEFTANQSPEARKAAIQKAVHLLGGRLEPMADAYSAGMGTTADSLSLLSPKAQASYKKLLGEASPNASVPGQSTRGAMQPQAPLDQKAVSNAILQAKSAIAKGAPRDAVLKRLQDNGIDPAGL